MVNKNSTLHYLQTWSRHHPPQTIVVIDQSLITRTIHIQGNDWVRSGHRTHVRLLSIQRKNQANLSTDPEHGG